MNTKSFEVNYCSFSFFSLFLSVLLRSFEGGSGYMILGKLLLHDEASIWSTNDLKMAIVCPEGKCVLIKGEVFAIYLRNLKHIIGDFDWEFSM